MHSMRQPLPMTPAGSRSVDPGSWTPANTRRRQPSGLDSQGKHACALTHRLSCLLNSACAERLGGVAGGGGILSQEVLAGQTSHPEVKRLRVGAAPRAAVPRVFSFLGTKPPHRVSAAGEAGESLACRRSMPAARRETVREGIQAIIWYADGNYNSRSASRPLAGAPARRRRDARWDL